MRGSLGWVWDVGIKIFRLQMWNFKRHSVAPSLGQGEVTEKVWPVKMIIILGSTSRTEIEDVNCSVIKDMHRISRCWRKDTSNISTSSMYRGRCVRCTCMQFKGHWLMWWWRKATSNIIAA